METHDDIPVARYRREGDLARVPDCPYCHKRHTHGVAGNNGQPTHRVAHCVVQTDNDKGYYLIPEGASV